MPRSSSPSLNIDEGKPWTLPAIIAPYDMPILKQKEVLQAERDSVMRQLSPFYDYSAAVSQQQEKRFMAKHKDGISGLPKSFVTTVSRKLHEIYGIGIISQDAFEKLAIDSTAAVQIVTEKTSKRTLLKDIFTPLSAYEYFFSDPQMASFRAQLMGCNINDYLEPNLLYNKELNEKAIQGLMNTVSENAGLIFKGEKIIDRGEIVGHTEALKLQSYTYEMSKNNSDSAKRVTLIGQIIFVLAILILFTIYIHLYRGDYFNKPRSLSMVYILVTLFPVIAALMMSYGFTNDYVYILPYAMVPIFIRVFLDSRTAGVALFATIMITSAVVAEPFEFIATEMISGFVAIYTLRELSKRSQIVLAAFLVTLTNLTILYAIHLMLPGDDMQLDVIAIKYFVFSGFFILLIYPLMILVEKVFDFTSAVTLFELSDTNKDVLRKLSEIAPGTFQHSIMVSNLAAAIASRIGAKSLLVRTGALYHDIGKMSNPAFFTENQAGINPHEKMTPIESAQLIISHVSEGVKLAEKHDLPDVIRDFILTHHGTGLAKFFYVTYKNQHPDQDVDTTYFRYPGPNPFTKEQAILMMADSVEAASRSLQEYTEESITTLVHRIIDTQVSDGAFHDCPITFHDIAQAKAVLIDKLKSIYHTRISYPELVNKKMKNEESEK